MPDTTPGKIKGGGDLASETLHLAPSKSGSHSRSHFKQQHSDLIQDDAQMDTYPPIREEESSVHKEINDQLLKDEEETKTLLSEDPAKFDMSNDSPLGIMENFADDFESTPEYTDEFFNREPYYYDEYYDATYDVSNKDIETNRVASENSSPSKDRNSAKSSIGPDYPMDYQDADVSSIQNALDLNLLGSDLQAELGLMLEQLTNGSLRNRRHQTPIKVCKLQGSYIIV